MTYTDEQWHALRRVVPKFTQEEMDALRRGRGPVARHPATLAAGSVFRREPFLSAHARYGWAMELFAPAPREVVADPERAARDLQAAGAPLGDLALALRVYEETRCQMSSSPPTAGGEPRRGLRQLFTFTEEDRLALYFAVQSWRSLGEHWRERLRSLVGRKR